MRGALALFALVASLAVASGAPARAGEPQYLQVTVQSKSLTAFWGEPMAVDADVLLPDSFYKYPNRRFPILYWIQAFDGNVGIDYGNGAELVWQRPMRRLHTEFIVVFLAAMFRGGHQEFVDSANNGPWGTALTTEFMPQIERSFHAIGTPQTRFVAGHSSGGWAALWLQVNYPDLFGGEWSLSPDPVDFRDFTGPDLTRQPPQNFFRNAEGRDYTLDGQPMRLFVVGPGWEKRQFESFDAVFSPKGSNGEPEPLFDRQTGAIDQRVAQHWERHYDIATILREQWPVLEPKLRGKLHIIVGTNDQFGLEAPVKLLQTELRNLGSDAEIDYGRGLNHFTIYDWDGGAIPYIINEAHALLTRSQ